MKIVIIGGGITGLTTALALHQLGIECQVYERAPHLSEVGAGIVLQPNAMKVLDHLGVGQLLRGSGVSLNTVSITNEQLVPFKGISKDLIKSLLGHQEILSVHRARLQEVLYKAIPRDCVHFGYAYEDHKCVGDQVKICFQNGETVTADVLLGADGIRSPIRQKLFPDSRLRYSGQTCWRGITEQKLPVDFEDKMYESWGRKGRFGVSLIEKNKVYWFAVINSPEGLKDEGDVSQKLTNIYLDFHPVIPEVIRNTPNNAIMRHDVFDLKRLKSWSKGNICLLGDAAHATTPNMGQGACQGIEDAYYLSQLLAKNIQQPSQVFRDFEQLRRKKVDLVVNTSWFYGKMAHSRIGIKVAQIIMGLTPQRILLKQVQAVYTLEKL